MWSRRVPLIGIGACLVLVLVVLVAVACGGTTATTSGPSTTAAGPTTTAAAPTTTAAAAIDAAALYAKDCKGCHATGVSGSAADIEAIIKSGKESMPGFSSSLSAEQITALAAYAAGGGK